MKSTLLAVLIVASCLLPVIMGQMPMRGPMNGMNPASAAMSNYGNAMGQGGQALQGMGDAMGTGFMAGAKMASSFGKMGSAGMNGYAAVPQAFGK